MASSYTTNYNLDKYVGTDKPNLRDQYNAAMDKIDAALLAANTNATEAKAATLSFQGDLDGVSAAVSAETTARQNADSALAEDITANSTAISNEATARQDADNALSQSIANEATARQNADNALSQSIANEATARQNADNALQANINLIIGKPLFVVVGDSWAETNLYGDWLTVFKKKMCVDVANYGFGGTGYNKQNGNNTNHGTFSQQLAYAATQISENDKKRVSGILVIGGVNDFSHNSFDRSRTINDIVTGSNALSDTRDNYFPNVPIYCAYNTMGYKYQNNPTLISKLYRAYWSLVNGALQDSGVIPLQNVFYSYLQSTYGFDSTNLHLNQDGAKKYGASIAASLNCGYSAEWIHSEAGPRNAASGNIGFANIEYKFDNGIYSIRPQRVVLTDTPSGTGTYAIPQTGGDWMFSIPQIAPNTPFKATEALSGNYSIQGYLRFDMNNTNNDGAKLMFTKYSPSAAGTQVLYNAKALEASILWFD